MPFPGTFFLPFHVEIQGIISGICQTMMHLVVGASSQAHQRIFIGTMGEFGLLCARILWPIRGNPAECETRQGQEGELAFYVQTGSQVVCNKFAWATGADSQGFVPNLLLKGFFCSASCPTSILIPLKLQFKLVLLPNPVRIFLCRPERELRLQMRCKGRSRIQFAPGLEGTTSKT
jgi:hypothetical protein